MPLVRVVFYLDVLSSWSYIADRAVEKLEEKYSGDVEFEWRIAQLFEFGPLPYSREELEWYYGRTARVTGVELNAAWVDSPQTTTVYANQAAEAARLLGAAGSHVRRGLTKAALLDGKFVGRRDVALEIAARLSGLSADRLSEAMDSAAVRDRIAETTREYAALPCSQLPAFVIRSAIDDTAIFSGLYTADSLETALGEMLHAAQVNRDYGNPPQVAS